MRKWRAQLHGGQKTEAGERNYAEDTRQQLGAQGAQDEIEIKQPSDDEESVIYVAVT
jgi:hypothetical protein